jgi:beta-xylosidase
VIGIDTDGDGKGEPVLNYPSPRTFILGKDTMLTSDEFNTNQLGLQWQWQANPNKNWASFQNNGALRLFSVYQPDSLSLFNTPFILGQKIPAEQFTATVKLTPTFYSAGEKAGLIILGTDFTSLCLVKTDTGILLQKTSCLQANKKGVEKIEQSIPVSSASVFIKIKVEEGGVANCSYSLEGNQFLPIGEKFILKPGVWVGAKLGLFNASSINVTKPGYVDIDWIRFEK